MVPGVECNQGGIRTVQTSCRCRYSKGTAFADGVWGDCCGAASVEYFRRLVSTKARPELLFVGSYCSRLHPPADHTPAARHSEHPRSRRRPPRSGGLAAAPEPISAASRGSLLVGNFLPKQGLIESNESDAAANASAADPVDAEGGCPAARAAAATGRPAVPPPRRLGRPVRPLDCQ